MVYLRCGIQVKNKDTYDVQATKKFQKAIKKISKYGVKRLTKSIQDSIQILCKESDMDALKSKLSFHQLNNYTITVDGTKYKNPYDVHVPGGGTNNNNDLVILFDYDHDNKLVILLDIGSHNSLNINGSVDMDNELIWL